MTNLDLARECGGIDTIRTEDSSAAIELTREQLNAFAERILTMDAEHWAELYRLREAVKGPDGYATWQDAATDERIKRVKAERAALASQSKPAEFNAQAGLSRMDEPQEREAFEKWFCDGDFSGLLEVRTDGSYTLMTAQVSWTAWKGRAALAAAPVASQEQCKAAPALCAVWNVMQDAADGDQLLDRLEALRPMIAASLPQPAQAVQPAAPVASEPTWQPIETAPKNMSDIDIWSRHGRIPDCSWGQTTYGRKIGFVYQSDYDCNGPVFELAPDPTHWMPLPPPPAGIGEPT